MQCSTKPTPAKRILYFISIHQLLISFLNFNFLKEVIIKKFLIYFFILFIFIITSCVNLFILKIPHSNSSNPDNSEYYFSNNVFIWPLPGYHQITSHFGPRLSPTSGASSNHSGIDIAAIEGTSIYSVCSGIVTHTGFKGANGHTIIVQNNNLEFTYAHVSPVYIVHIGDYISQNNIIGYVGPKYLSNGNSSYIDSSGRYTNGATTGCHLHLSIKKDGIAVNPLLFFK